jgi:glycosyltransferase involved in cell wall biosynthesis
MASHLKLPKADVCLILEGTYPYVQGGVSTWTHELIQMQSHLSFVIVSLMAPGVEPELKFILPANVIGIRNVTLQELHKGAPARTLNTAQQETLFGALEAPLMNLQSDASLQDLMAIISALAPHRAILGSDILLNSDAAWGMLRRMYDAMMPESSFLDYFWSWRVLFGGLYSILQFDLPQASVYHALCTGYAGVTLARAHIETGRPCIVTEHCIYTNERRIEIASADWLDDQSTMSLTVTGQNTKRSLKDFWIDTFRSYSKLCYEASSKVLTLYEGNQSFQRADGAAEHKLAVIPNGIDVERYGSITNRTDKRAAVALIGRVVPVKDVKTYIKAIGLLHQRFPDLQAYIIGPTDEDPLYFGECEAMIAHLGLKENIIFTGKVNVADYLSRIDIVVLTSLSEAQPLVILEAGAAGIPSVATNVGACSEMIMGNSHEQPKLGAGGGVSALSNPESTAHHLYRLLTDTEFYKQCSTAMRQRVKKYYNKKDQHASYAALYETLLAKPAQKSVA